ncbi:MAG: glycosyltransferase family 2 protein [Pirellulales bacterium]
MPLLKPLNQNNLVSSTVGSAAGSTHASQVERNLDQLESIVGSSLDSDAIELSIVMPCLNEADTLATCIEKCQRVIAENGYRAEVIIADNGSTDGSIEIAQSLGARVVNVAAKGYGNALRGGIVAARGKFVIMGDADDSYDFLEVPKFVDKLRQGHQLVQGCRLPAGGGTVKPGAMPFTHRWIGNPMFSAMVQRMFRAPIHDVYCGLRGFSREFVSSLDLQCCGMEFATEMIIKSSLFQASIAEVPITLHPDGRKAHAPHLRTLRDGWRTLRFFLVYSPRYLFLVPGLALMLVGLIAYALAMPAVQLFGATFDAHTLLFGTLALMMGYQTVQFAIFSKTFAVQQGLMPNKKSLDRYSAWFTLERGLVYGALLLTVGVTLLALAIDTWRIAQFGRLDYAAMMRVVIPGMTAAAIGFQTILSSFFLGVLRLARRSEA